MNPQEFLSQIPPDTFSEATLQEVRAIIGDATEMTPEMADRVAECMEREMDEDLKDVEVDPAAVAILEQKLEADLAQIDAMTDAGTAAVEKDLQELADMSQKVDVLERLHSN